MVLVTLSCGQKVIVNKTNENWLQITSGSFKGYVLQRNLSKEVKNCFSRKFSKFYNELDLDMREIYKMGG